MSGAVVALPRWILAGFSVTATLLVLDLVVHFPANYQVPKPNESNQTLLQLERIARINKTCQKHGLAGKGIFAGNGYGLHIVKSRGVAYCENAKTGCSSWKQILLWLQTGISGNSSSSDNSSAVSLFDIHHKANQVLHVSNNGLDAKDLTQFPQFVREQGLLLFTTVRHPFDRLVSAFENKILHRKDPIYYSLSDRVGGNFSRFVDRVLERGSSKCDPVGSCVSLDNHWRPFGSNCHYCSLLPGKREKTLKPLLRSTKTFIIEEVFFEWQQDFVATVETFEEDIRHFFSVIRNFDPQGEVHDGLIAREAKRLRLNTSPPEKDRTLNYFRELSKQQRDGLARLYSLDFEMFGYSLHPYDELD